MNHGPPGGPDSPRLLTQGLWRLATSSEVIRARCLRSAASLYPDLRPFVLFFASRRSIPPFLSASLPHSCALNSFLENVNTTVLKNSGGVREGILLRLSKSLCCSAALNPIRKKRTNEDKSSHLGRSGGVMLPNPPPPVTQCCHLRASWGIALSLTPQQKQPSMMENVVIANGQSLCSRQR